MFNNTRLHQSRRKGFTLVEILVVTTIIAVVAIPFLITYRNSRANQALRVSAEQFADQARSVHVFAREAKDKKSWGLMRMSDTSYAILSGSDMSSDIVTTRSLESQITFLDEFTVWFTVGTGETSDNSSIRLSNPNGIVSRVEINKNGVVEVFNE